MYSLTVIEGDSFIGGTVNDQNWIIELSYCYLGYKLVDIDSIYLLRHQLGGGNKDGGQPPGEHRLPGSFLGQQLRGISIGAVNDQGPYSGLFDYPESTEGH